MSPGELAMVLALLRVMVEAHPSDWAPMPMRRLFGEYVPHDGDWRGAMREVRNALGRQGYYTNRFWQHEGRLAAIDRAILEAEALEDMGAVEVLP